MNRDQSKSKVDESSSKSNSVLGRREEGFGSASFARGSNFEVGSSSSHSHVNNLQEQQRLMMLRSQGMPHPPAFNQPVNYHMNNLEEQRRRLHYRRMMERMPRTQHTDPSSSSNTVKAPVYPPGSRFLPTDVGCVRVHLRNKVDKDKSGFITTLDLYKDDPWLLGHVQNDLFERGEWYYFTPRNKRGASSCNRTVGGRGGGTWKSTSGKEPIKDKYQKVQGYKQSLVHNKTNVNGKIESTGWNMTEYCLYEENQDDLVLCHVKGNIKKKGFIEAVKKTNILSTQVQNPEEEAGANGVEMRTPLQEDHQQQKQQQEQDTPSLLSIPSPHDDGQGLGAETTQNNENNFMMPKLQEDDHGDATQQQQQEPQEKDAPVLFNPLGEYQNLELMMTMQNNFMTTLLPLNHSDAPQQLQQEQDAPPVLVPPPHEGQDSGFERTLNNDNNFMLQQDHGDATQQQQQQQQEEQDAPPVPPVFPPLEGQDAEFEKMMDDEINNFMARWDEDQQPHQPHQFDDSDLYELDLDDLLDFSDLPENDCLVGPV